MMSSKHVLVVVARTYAEMEWLIRLLLIWPLLKPTPSPSQSQLYHLLHWPIESLRTHVHYPLHIAPLGTNEFAGDLELFLVDNLDIKAAGVFNGGDGIVGLPRLLVNVLIEGLFGGLSLSGIVRRSC